MSERVAQPGDVISLGEDEELFLVREVHNYGGERLAYGVSTFPSSSQEIDEWWDEGVLKMLLDEGYGKNMSQYKVKDPLNTLQKVGEWFSFQLFKLKGLV